MAACAHAFAGQLPLGLFLRPRTMMRVPPSTRRYFFSRPAPPAWPGAPPSDAASRGPLLLTPGPLTTSAGVRVAAAFDVGSRDGRFIECVASVRSRVLALAGVSPATHAAVLLPGSGTYGVESVLISSVPRRGGRLLVAANGAYGERIAAIARGHGIAHSVLRRSERRALDANAVLDALARGAGGGGGGFSHLAIVHHETTAGVLNPLAEIGAAVAALPSPPALIVDSMSALGAHPLDAAAASAAFVVSSANKCVQGLPGFSFVVAERGALARCAGVSPSLSLDLHAQWLGLERGGQFRFTPPTQALLAFDAALDEHAAEGGSAARLARYAANLAVLREDMAELGFSLYVEAPAERGCIISTFLLPDDARFDFPTFYSLLAERGLVIYPGKLTRDACFRIGTIGHLFPADMRRLTLAVRDVLRGMGVALPVRQVAAAAEPPDELVHWP